MRAKHRKTLKRVFARPTPPDIRWDDFEAMLRASGVNVVMRSGSRVGLVKEEERLVVHRPHPAPLVSPETIRDIAAFLQAAGVQP